MADPADQPIESHAGEPTPADAQASKTKRQRRRALVMGIAVLLSLVLAAVAINWQLNMTTPTVRMPAENMTGSLAPRDGIAPLPDDGVNADAPFAWPAPGAPLGRPPALAALTAPDGATEHAPIQRQFGGRSEWIATWDIPASTTAQVHDHVGDQLEAAGFVRVSRDAPDLRDRRGEPIVQHTFMRQRDNGEGDMLTLRIRRTTGDAVRAVLWFRYAMADSTTSSPDPDSD